MKDLGGEILVRQIAHNWCLGVDESVQGAYIRQQRRTASSGIAWGRESSKETDWVAREVGGHWQWSVLEARGKEHLKRRERLVVYSTTKRSIKEDVFSFSHLRNPDVNIEYRKENLCKVYWVVCPLGTITESPQLTMKWPFEAKKRTVKRLLSFLFPITKISIVIFAECVKGK